MNLIIKKLNMIEWYVKIASLICNLLYMLIFIIKKINFLIKIGFSPIYIVINV